MVGPDDGSILSFLNLRLTKRLLEVAVVVVEEVVKVAMVVFAVVDAVVVAVVLVIAVLCITRKTARRARGDGTVVTL